MKLGAFGTVKSDGTRVVVTGTWNSGEGIFYCRRWDGREALLLASEVAWDEEPAAEVAR